MPLLLLIPLYLTRLSPAATTTDDVPSDTYGNCVTNVVATIDITPVDKSGCSECSWESRDNPYAHLHTNAHSKHTSTLATQARDGR